MNTRSSTSVVTFLNSFTLSGYPDELPAGAYEVVVEEELLQGHSFEAYRRTATRLVVRGAAGFAGRTEMRRTTERDLEAALGRDRTSADGIIGSDAALSPQEDL